MTQAEYELLLSAAAQGPVLNKEFSSDDERRAAFAHMAEETDKLSHKAKNATRRAKRYGGQEDHEDAVEAHRDAMEAHKASGNGKQAAYHAKMMKAHSGAAELATNQAGDTLAVGHSLPVFNEAVPHDDVEALDIPQSLLFNYGCSEAAARVARAANRYVSNQADVHSYDRSQSPGDRRRSNTGPTPLDQSWRAGSDDDDEEYSYGEPEVIDPEEVLRRAMAEDEVTRFNRRRLGLDQPVNPPARTDVQWLPAKDDVLVIPEPTKEAARYHGD
jgi:hypothetical protein